MSRFGTSKAKDAIIGAAAANRWNVTHQGETSITLQRGRVKIAVRFGRTGDIFSASVLGSHSIGSGRTKDKLDAVLAEMNREP